MRLFFPVAREQLALACYAFSNLVGLILTFLINHGLTIVLFVVTFSCLTVYCVVYFFSLQGRSISRALQVRMGKSKNMVKDG